MVSTTERELLTLDEAASLLHVDRAIVERLVESGRLTAVAVQTTSIRVKRQDVEEVGLTRSATPANVPHVGIRYVTSEDELRRKLTPEEIEAGLDAFRVADRERERILAERGGELFPPSWELIREGRDER